MRDFMWVLATLTLILSSSTSAFAFGKKPQPVIHSNAVISDSLVKNLQCSTLSEDTVLASLQLDAFDTDRNLQLQNWADVINIAHCWALARTQRLIYFLSRTGDDHAPLVEPATTNADDVSKMFHSPLEPYVIFRETGDVAKYFDDAKRLQGDIDFYQLARFSNPSNLGLMMGWGDRSKDDNAQSFAQIQADLAKNWHPLLVLRMNPFAQHVVMVKRIHDADASGNLVLDVYDSNRPWGDTQMTYSSADREFMAPDYIQDELKSSAPVGIFLVDEGDMGKIQTALLTYYTNWCEAN